MRISDWSSDVCSSDLSIAIRILSSIKRMLLPERSGAFKSLNAIPLTCLTCLPARAKHRIKVSHRRRRVTGKIRQSDQRTEEHTSELQSHMSSSDAVLCLKQKM